MSIVRNVGGDRLGQDSKMKVKMHGYQRSSHNLSRVWRSSLAPGVLVPCFCEVGLNGDTFNIDLNEMIRTLPTSAPLFGSFKLQIDFFKADLRLYNSVLHNNQFGIGMNMKQVYLPKVEFEANWQASTADTETEYLNSQINPSSLAHYLGISGIASGHDQDPEELLSVVRNFNATPMLTYYDIFKNYYANKQETNCYVIAPSIKTDGSTFPSTIYEIATIGGNKENSTTKTYQSAQWYRESGGDTQCILGINGYMIIKSRAKINNTDTIEITTSTGKLSTASTMRTNKLTILNVWMYQGYYFAQLKTDNGAPGSGDARFGIINIPTDIWNKSYIGSNDIAIQSIPLTNFDKMRELLLNPNNTGLGKELVIGSQWLTDNNIQYPYTLFGNINDTSGKSNAYYSMSGLMLKTYQSDINTCWVKSETIQQVNGIAAVSTASGSFTIDSLNLAQKVYNMLNRIAVSGGSYYDWQEVIWGERVTGAVETPIYIGGTSSEVVFEEVVSTSDTDTKSAGQQPLGSLAGKGKLMSKRNGSIKVKCKEPCIIMGIVSITPRVDYAYGNKWFMTEINSMDDLHKPALDGIGWQDLLGERQCWTATHIGEQGEIIKDAIGKQPAWLNYMTAVNEVHGDFADNRKAGYMVLKREYHGINNPYSSYVNPTSYNYAFAVSDIYAQNFWLQIAIDCIARRKMSAKQIPNL